MQLNRPESIRNIGGLLTAATCTLLQQTATAQEIPGWYVDTAVLGYSEKDRVDAVEPVVSATRIFDNGNKLTLKYVMDSLTGASPNGATISDRPQTFTRPSGRDSFVTSAGAVPLDDTFKDTRNAVSAQYEFSLDSLTRLSTGLAYSDEYDYTSVGFNATVARDFFNKNTTLLAGLSFAADSIEPEGGIPREFASVVITGSAEPAGSGEDDDFGDDAFDASRRSQSDDKTITDFLIGVTQVINASTLMQFNYSYSLQDGYLTDPFKLLSWVDPITGRPQDYRYENRPDSRTKHSLYWKTKYSLPNRNVIDFSYRYLWDDWDITSHTLDLRYLFDVSEKIYLEPHVRYYTQSEADFFTHSLVAGQPLPEFASADYRLGAFEGVTYGSKIGYRINRRSEVSARLELYQQTGDTIGRPIGIQANYDLFPDLEAVIFQLSYSYRF